MIDNTIFPACVEYVREQDRVTISVLEADVSARRRMISFILFKAS